MVFCTRLISAMPATTEPAALPQLCYHCGEQVPTGADFSVSVDGSLRPMCCPGCRAVAQLIAASGMDGFYRQRTAYNTRPESAAQADSQRYLIYDDTALAATFSQIQSDGTVSAQLLLGGMTCAACTWLIEQTVTRIPGVHSATVNLQQSRLQIRFDPRQVKLSTLFSRVAALGYQVRPFRTSTQRQQMAEEARAELRRLAVAGLGMMQVGMFAIALHAGDIQGIQLQYQTLLRWVSLLVASFVVFYSARPFFSSAWRHLKIGALVMDLPVALAIGLAWTASAWATVFGTGQVYFDSVVMFTFFLLLGRFLEHRARQRNSLAWFDAESSLPDAVTVLTNGHWQIQPRAQLQGDETLLISAGSTVPADAVVTVGSSAVSEETFNGEHLPRQVNTGDRVYAGTINVEAALQVRVTGSYRDSRLAALQRSVLEASTEKPALAQLADRVASWFVAAVLLITAATALWWFRHDPQRALWVCLSVLVVSCPCALALATPTALTSAAGALRRIGVIVRTGNALEALARITHLVFDKTGTLTEGSLSIAQIHCLSDTTEAEVLAIATGLQHYSTHPVARAFRGHSVTLSQVQYRVGAGLEGCYRNNTFRLGSLDFCREIAPMLGRPPQDALYWIALCRTDRPVAWIGLADRTRDETADVVATAQKNGLAVALLTGDSTNQGPLLALQLGIGTVYTGLTPEQKMHRVKTLQAQGAIVGMVGDGLNDAPVLKLADASFAVAGATDLAQTQADFVIAGGNLWAVIDTWRQARKCRQIIRQNLLWALGYNLSAIPLAAMGYVPPWAAAVGMSVSSLLVVGNSLRLNTPPRRPGR